MKFEEPYAALLDDGVRFYAVLGNHDDPEQRLLRAVQHGRRTLLHVHAAAALAGRPGDRRPGLCDRQHASRRRAARVAVARASNRRRAGRSCLLHHPLYTSGRYPRRRASPRWQLESLLVEHGVDVVFSGHEHIYQRSRLRQGVQSSSPAAPARCAAVTARRPPPSRGASTTTSTSCSSRSPTTRCTSRRLRAAA